MSQHEGSKNPVKPDVTWQYQPELKKNGFPWGPHRIPFSISFDSYSLALSKTDTGFRYQRQGPDGSVEKNIMTERGNIIFSPVEPFHCLAGISTHLLIEFGQPIVLEPRASKEILITFPLEIACTIQKKHFGERILDIISINNSKMSLYGNVRNGLICRYWKSEIFASMPAVNPLKEGVMKLLINNSGNRWADINLVIFNAHGMKIFFNSELVFTHATMKIINELSAETTFYDKPLKPGMKKAFEQFSVKMLSQTRRTVMEEGY